jgi:hypothetical protein
MRSLFVFGPAAFLGLLWTAPESAGAQSSKEAVLQAGQAVFDAMARRDTAALRDLLHPMAHLMASVETADSTTVRAVTRDQFLAQVAAAPTMIERMWNAEVKVSGTIASIWTQYDFHQGPNWSHCGIDAFHLVKTGRGWQVTSIIYTVVRDAARCPKHPLGPPKS